MHLDKLLGRLSIRPCTSQSIRKSFTRSFSTSKASQSWLIPKTIDLKSKTPKGRPRVPIGGSTRGTTVIWGDYGLRMIDHDRRLNATQLKAAEEVVKKRLRGEKYKLYTRISANIAVYTKGNETRMGKGKGGFDYWAARVPVSRVIMEIKGDVHELAIRDAFRLVAHRLPGLYEVVKKGDPPVMGITKLDGVTEAELRRPRRPIQSTTPIQDPVSTPTPATT